MAGAGGVNLNFTPYQQAQFGTTKHSSSLPQSNPLFNAGPSADGTLTVGGSTGQPAATLAVSKSKKVWG